MCDPLAMTSPRHQFLSLTQHFNLVDLMQPQFHVSKSELGFPLSMVCHYFCLLFPLIIYIQNLGAIIYLSLSSVFLPSVTLLLIHPISLICSWVPGSPLRSGSARVNKSYFLLFEELIMYWKRPVLVCSKGYHPEKLWLDTCELNG